MTSTSQQRHASFVRAPSRAGFTLLELVISVSVVALLATLLATGYGGSQKSTAVRDAARQFASTLREAETLAQNGVKAPACLAQYGVQPACSVYTVAYTANSGAYTRATQSNTDTQSFTLPNAAQFASAGTLTFSYVPPLVHVTGSPAPTVKIDIQGPVASTQKTSVCVYGMGRIELRTDARACPP